MDGRQVWILCGARSAAIMLEGIFRRAGFGAERLTGEAALFLRLRRESPALLVLDEAAVQAGGEELRARLERCAPRPPVILLAEARGAGEEPPPLPGLRVGRPVRARAVLAAARRLLAAPGAAPPPPAAADVALVGFGEQGPTLAAALERAGYRSACLAAGEAVPLGLRQGYRVLLLDMQAPEAGSVLRGLGLAHDLAVVTVGRIGWHRAGELCSLPSVRFLERPVELPRLLEAVAAPLPAGAGGAA